MSEITKEQFDKYVEVQRSGATNMFNVHVVAELSGLRVGDVITIQQNYMKLSERYGTDEVC